MAIMMVYRLKLLPKMVFFALLMIATPLFVCSLFSLHRSTTAYYRSLLITNVTLSEGDHIIGYNSRSSSISRSNEISVGKPNEQVKKSSLEQINNKIISNNNNDDGAPSTKNKNGDSNTKNSINTKDIINDENYKDSGKIINPPLDFLINVKDACENKTVELFMPVHSAITNFERRSKIRTLPQKGYANDKENHAILLFFVGVPSTTLNDTAKFQRWLQVESEQYGDIVQINVTDAYRNLAYKATAVLQWITTYCPHSTFVLKMDDDVNVKPGTLMLALYRKQSRYKDFITGERRSDREPLRSPTSKWYMPEEQYPNATYPPFIMGSVIGYATTSVLRLYQCAIRTKVIWLDDVFITGICSRKIKIPLLHDTKFMNAHRKTPSPPNFVLYQ